MPGLKPFETRPMPAALGRPGKTAAMPQPDCLSIPLECRSMFSVSTTKTFLPMTS